MAKWNKKKSIILSLLDSKVMKREASYKDENVANCLCSFFLWREAKCYVQIDGCKSSMTLLGMNTYIRQTLKFMLDFSMCKMQITRKKKWNPLPVVVVELFHIHAQSRAGCLQMRRLSAGLLSRTVFVEEWKGPCRVWQGKRVFWSWWPWQWALKWAHWATGCYSKNPYLVKWSNSALQRSH